MIDNYINNFENVISSILFIAFKVILLALVILLILSLIMLALGCLIKSQKIKSKFLVSTFGLLIGTILFLSFPFLFVYFKSLI